LKKLVLALSITAILAGGCSNEEKKEVIAKKPQVSNQNKESKITQAPYGPKGDIIQVPTIGEGHNLVVDTFKVTEFKDNGISFQSTTGGPVVFDYPVSWLKKFGIHSINEVKIGDTYQFGFWAKDWNVNFYNNIITMKKDVVVKKPQISNKKNDNSLTQQKPSGKWGFEMKEIGDGHNIVYYTFEVSSVKDGSVYFRTDDLKNTMLRLDEDQIKPFGIKNFKAGDTYQIGWWAKDWNTYSFNTIRMFKKI